MIYGGTSESHQVAFIFDWDKRHDEFTIVRVTKEIVSAKPNHIPRYLKYLGSQIREFLDEDWLKTLPTGRYHWRGTVIFSRDYWSGFDEEWWEESTVRIR